MVIEFYGKRDPYWEFTNFYVRPIVVAEVIWPVGTEQYYQAMKSMDPAVQEHVRTQLKTPREVKDYCTTQLTLRADWDTCIEFAPAMVKSFSDERGIVVEYVKDHFMYAGLIAKYTQHDDLKALLLGTGDQELVENTRKRGVDPYWGNGPNGDGLNKLGRMLMLVRATLRRRG